VPRAARSAGSSEIGSDRSGFSIEGPSPLMKSKRTPMAERQEQIGEEDCGVHLDPADRLQRHLSGEVRVRHKSNQRVALAQGAVLGHVPPA